MPYNKKKYGSRAKYRRYKRCVRKVKKKKRKYPVKNPYAICRAAIYKK